MLDEAGVRALASMRGSEPGFAPLDVTVNGHPLVYLDSANTSQKPRQVIDAMRQVGDTLPASLRETGEGGCAACPSVCERRASL